MPSHRHVFLEIGRVLKYIIEIEAEERRGRGNGKRVVMDAVKGYKNGFTASNDNTP